MKKLFLWMLLAAGCMSVMAQQRVKISGHVTDFDGKPISHCAVMLMDKHFHTVDSASTDSAGYYCITNVKPGRYMALTAVRWNEYVRFSKLPEQDRRLEFWAWNIMADKDLTINPRYHRLELYGTTAFCPTGTNALIVYTRPPRIPSTTRKAKTFATFNLHILNNNQGGEVNPESDQISFFSHKYLAE